jgi:hypothetical protein
VEGIFVQHAQDRIFPLVRIEFVAKRATAINSTKSLSELPTRQFRLPMWRARQEAVGHADKLRDETKRMGADDTAGTGFAQSGMSASTQQLER